MVTLVIDQYNDLEFEWNRNVYSTATSGGVRIEPLDQLLLVQVQGGNNVYILDGFTNINELRVDTNSLLYTSIT